MFGVTADSGWSPECHPRVRMPGAVICAHPLKRSRHGQGRKESGERNTRRKIIGPLLRKMIGPRSNPTPRFGIAKTLRAGGRQRAAKEVCGANRGIDKADERHLWLTLNSRAGGSQPKRLSACSYAGKFAAFFTRWAVDRRINSLPSSRSPALASTKTTTTLPEQAQGDDLSFPLLTVVLTTPSVSRAGSTTSQYQGRRSFASQP